MNVSLASDVAKLRACISPSLRIELDEKGFAKASDKKEDEDNPTHYDAVWVRDSLWIYLGLKDTPETTSEAKRILRGMLRYFSTDHQLDRLRSVISNPSQLNHPIKGPMMPLHIRFDRNSPNLDDVHEKGLAQTWNHKQNDALGLFYLCTLEALFEGFLSFEELNPTHWQVLLLLPTYFSKIKYFEMEDAGSWEEIERLNTSSVALVTSSLEVLEHGLQRPDHRQLFLDKIQINKLENMEQVLSSGKLKGLIDAGYDCIENQLPRGESPNYPEDSPKFRTSDAALLNLLYPCKLKKLDEKDYRRVLELLQPLIREIGIIRYEGDSYQSMNYWKMQLESSPTDDYSEDKRFIERGKQMLPGTEAQWFFDSWLSKAYGVLYKKHGKQEDLKQEVAHLNRALDQLTDSKSTVLGADEHPVPSGAFPESYNVIQVTPEKKFAPSPITPLNWAKACLSLALNQLTLNLKGQNEI